MQFKKIFFILYKNLILSNIQKFSISVDINYLYYLFFNFGANKTLGSVKMILDSLSKGKIVFTNIKFNTNYIDKKFINNLYQFNDIKVLHDILAFSGYFATKVIEYNGKAIVEYTDLYSRKNRPKVEIYFDEMGTLANSSDYQKFYK